MTRDNQLGREGKEDKEGKDDRTALIEIPIRRATPLEESYLHQGAIRTPLAYAGMGGLSRYIVGEVLTPMEGGKALVGLWPRYSGDNETQVWVVDHGDLCRAVAAHARTVEKTAGECRPLEVADPEGYMRVPVQMTIEVQRELVPYITGGRPQASDTTRRRKTAGAIAEMAKKAVRQWLYELHARYIPHTPCTNVEWEGEQDDE